MLVPDYWGRLTYIFMFYFIGCYFRDYKLHISFSKNIVALLVSLIVFGLFNYYRTYNGLFGSSGYAYYNSIEMLVITILFVNLILNLKLNVKNKYVIKFISKVSYLTFGGFLVSTIFDRLFYSYFYNDNMLVLDKLPYLLVIIPLIILCSLFFSYLVDIFINFSKKIFKRNIFRVVE